MPAMRTYTVVQEREVKIRASSPTEAVYLGNAFFNEKDEDASKNVRSVPGHAVSEVKEIEIRATED